MTLARTLRLLLVSLLVCASLAAPLTHARADDDARSLAASHFKRGIEQANQHAYAEALTEFEAAYKLVQRAGALYNIALAQTGLGRPAAAVATLRRYLAEPAEPHGEAQHQAALSLLDELVQKLSLAAPANITVVVFPYGKVWIDGRALGSSPLTTSVPAGPHQVSGGREQPDLSQQVTLEAGASTRVVLPWGRKDLVPVETPAP